MQIPLLWKKYNTHIFIRLGKDFDVTLVYQAIVMIFAQLIMLHLCVTLEDEGHKFSRNLNMYGKQL